MAWNVPLTPGRAPCAALGRRAAISQGAALLGLVHVAASKVANAAPPPDLSDLDMGEPLSSAPKISIVEDLSVAEPQKLEMVTLSASGAKAKKETPASRLKELQAKGGSITEKEKQEMRRLKADEMCEMLGRGC